MEQLSIRPRDVVKRELVEEWLGKAAQVLAVARVLFRQGAQFWGPLGFHAQQAAEKYLKAYLTHHQIEFPKTHQIQELLELASRVNPAVLSTLRATVALTPYGVETRYPGGEEPASEEAAAEAIRLAERVRDHVLGALGRAS
jgi:HEPN domain-containing protein